MLWSASAMIILEGLGAPDMREALLPWPRRITPPIPTYGDAGPAVVDRLGGVHFAGREIEQRKVRTASEVLLRRG